MDLHITALYAGLLTIWIFFLAARVGSARRKANVLLGDGGDKGVLIASRAHGNAVETVPLTLLLMALAEAMGAPAIALHLAGLGLLVGRLVHGYYFISGAEVLIYRMIGMMLTILVQLALAAGLIGHALLASPAGSA